MRLVNIYFLKNFTAFIFPLAFSLKVYSGPQQTNETDRFPDVFAGWVRGINREVDLFDQLKATNTNGVLEMDRKLCSALPLKGKQLVQYLQISVVFHYPTTNECTGSSTEMDQPDSLIYNRGQITHTNSATEGSNEHPANGVPLDYIRVVDPEVKHVEAELCIFVKVSPLSSLKPPRFFKRSFWFVYEDGWTEKKHLFQSKGKRSRETNWSG